MKMAGEEEFRHALNYFCCQDNNKEKLDAAEIQSVPDCTDDICRKNRPAFVFFNYVYF